MIQVLLGLLCLGGTDWGSGWKWRRPTVYVWFSW